MSIQESLNTHLQAFQAIKEIPEADFSTRNNAFVDARTALTTFIEEELPEHRSDVEGLKSEEDVDVTNETVDSYIELIEVMIEGTE